MAKTVLGYFRKGNSWQPLVTKLVDDGYDPELINVIFDDVKDTSDDQFDNTIEASPVAEFKEALFDADVTEEDAEYYQAEIEKGNTLIAIYVPSNPQEGRMWENELANRISDDMRSAGAYDREIRPIYSNRGMTTYPQNRFTDPAGLLNAKDRIYRSASTLNQERSTTLGSNIPDEVEVVDMERGGREVVSGTSMISQFASAEAELLQKIREKQQKSE